jgi:tetratricopeptide (TPR) repeat protein
MKSKKLVIFSIMLCSILSNGQHKLNYSDTLMYLGTKSYKDLDLIRAKEKLDSCIMLNSKNDECRYYRAKVEFDMKSYSKASIMFKNVLALQVNDASSWHMLGLCFTNLKHYDSAEFCYQNAVRLNSKRSEFYANWANNEFLRGNIVHAEQVYSTAILLDEKNAEYYASRAIVRETLGDKANADNDIQIAHNLDPNNKTVQATMSKKQGFKTNWLYITLGLSLVLFVLILLRKKLRIIGS